jgi:hypothetical protein
MESIRHSSFEAEPSALPSSNQGAPVPIAHARSRASFSAAACSRQQRPRDLERFKAGPLLPKPQTEGPPQLG